MMLEHVTESRTIHTIHYHPWIELGRIKVGR
jgi:hypothetical protein